MEHAIIGLHHVEVAVLREALAEPIGGLAGAPGAERIGQHNVVAVCIDHAPRTDDRRAAGQRRSNDPLLIHVGRVA